MTHRLVVPRIERLVNFIGDGVLWALWVVERLASFVQRKPKNKADNVNKP